MKRCIELFCCSGGMAEGFRRAGIKFDLAFDFSDDACASYEANLGHRPIQIDVRDLLRLVRNVVGAGFHSGAIDLLVADPPCTPWSRSGKRKGLDDERDMLVETVEAIRLLRPRTYLIGNVPGLQDASSWGVVQRLIGGLARDGYCVRDYAQLDAANYGVPQHRVRPFWFGHLDGPCIQWPAPTHCDPDDGAQLPGVSALRQKVRARRPWVTCREALRHLSVEDMGRPVRLRWKDGEAGPNHRPSQSDAPARTLTGNTHSDGSLLVNPRHPASRSDSPAHTITGCARRTSEVLEVGRPSQGMRVGSPDKPGSTVTSQSSRIGAGAGHTLEWPWDRPSTTILGDPRIGPPEHHDGSFLSAPNAIVLSERAAKILQGFPEHWVFAGKTKASRWSQLGMAMPPALAHAVALSIVQRARRSEAA